MLYGADTVLANTVSALVSALGVLRCNVDYSNHMHRHTHLSGTKGCRMEMQKRCALSCNVQE